MRSRTTRPSVIFVFPFWLSASFSASFIRLKREVIPWTKKYKFVLTKRQKSNTSIKCNAIISIEKQVMSTTFSNGYRGAVNLKESKLLHKIFTKFMVLKNLYFTFFRFSNFCPSPRRSLRKPRGCAASMSLNFF